MNGFIKLAIKQPIAVAALVFLIIAFGLVASKNSYPNDT